MKLQFAFLLTCLLWINASPAGAAESVRFTVTVARAIVRGGPGTTYLVLTTVVRGQTFTVAGRTLDSVWLRVSLPRVAGETWIKAGLGTVKGDLNGVVAIDVKAPTSATALPPPGMGVQPVTGVQPLQSPPGQTLNAPTPSYSTAGPANPAVAAATNRAREIYQAGLALGSRPGAFSKVGDCQSVTPMFLASFDSPTQYRLGDYGYLQETIDNFKGSFVRESLAAKNGMNTASVLSPLWADSARCAKGENPLECEYRLHRPAFALIGLGTNGAWQSDLDYDSLM